MMELVTCKQAEITAFPICKLTKLYVMILNNSGKEKRASLLMSLKTKIEIVSGCELEAVSTEWTTI